MENTGFHRRRDPNFILSSDPCLTAVGAPFSLARNYAAYSAIGRPRRGRWAAWERDGSAFDAAASFLRERDDICLPAEFLADLIQEDSKLSKSSQCLDLPDHACGDLSWPGPCLENLISEADAFLPSPEPPLLIHTTGPATGDLALLRPRGRCCSKGTFRDDWHRNPNSEGSRASKTDGSVYGATSGAVTGERLALDAGCIRQISALMPISTQPPQVFARCDYNATLVELRGDVDLPTATALSRENNAQPTPQHDDFSDGRRGLLGRFRERMSGLRAMEKLVFTRRLTCTACSPYTRANAAFVDEDFRLFTWHPNRGAVMYGSAPLRFPSSAPRAIEISNDGSRTSRVEETAVRARRARNADVSLDYGHHPRVLWMAGQHKAYRVDLREHPSPATLSPALDPRVYFAFSSAASTVKGGSGRFEGRGQPPKVRALAVGRRSVHEVFVAAGLHLACMDDRFPRDAVARWDLPEEVNQLRWLPGLPGEGIDAEEIILASGRTSPGFYVNTWAKDVPGWRGMQTRLGLDDTSPAASSARRPLTFGLPASPLSEGETRSGALIVSLPPEGDEARQGIGGSYDMCLIHATSTGDVYGQLLEQRRIGGEEGGVSEDTPPTVALVQRSSLVSDRIQSMLPCGDLCLDPKPAADSVVEDTRGSYADSRRGAGNNMDGGDSSLSHDGSDRSDDNTSSGLESMEVDDNQRRDLGRSRWPKAGARRKRRQQGLSPSSRPLKASEKTSSSVGNGSGSTFGGPRKPQYFPLNAGALRTSLEVVPASELSTSRRLPPLLKLVTERQGERSCKQVRKAENLESWKSAHEERKLGLAVLQQRKEDVAKFLLQPRTPTELLAFCRKKLKAYLPGDSASTRTDERRQRSENSSQGIVGTATRESNRGRKSAEKHEIGGVSDDEYIDDAPAAADVARTVLAWGPPFRSIDTGWRIAPAPGSFVVVGSSGSNSSACHAQSSCKIDCVVLCSAREMLKSEPSALLAPGRFGAPFASDFTVEDVRWLKGQWKP